MAFTNGIVALAAIFLFTSNIELVQSLDMTYCASINTASTNANASIYQSDGLCHDFCLSEYAFSVLQDDSCWCSNYVPDKTTQVDTDECNISCHGFPSDTCGGDGLWGYIALDKEPVGTSGASTSTKTSSPDITDKTTTATSHTSTTTPTPSPSVSVHTVTAGGTVSLQTVTVIPTVTAGVETSATSDANTTGMTASHQGLSTGQAVGVAIGVLGAVAIAIAAGVFFFLRRRRRQGQGDIIEDPSGSHRGSSAGMMSTPTTTMASVWDGENTATGRRNSRFMPHDPRMDPYTTNIYSRFDNKSHESVNTLQDNHDYSRKVLRTTNPDPTDPE
ncbi:THO2 plays a role in transcriptional elongation [Hypoxylon texense]